MYRYNNINYYPYRYNRNPNGDRFFGGGILLPFILGGIAGRALARPYPYPYPVPYPFPVYYSSFPTTYNNTDYNVYY